MKNYDYIHDGSEIYRNSFAIIRREANLAAFSPEEEKIVVRMIHACGMVDLVSDILISPTFAHNAKSALKKMPRSFATQIWSPMASQGRGFLQITR